MADYTREGIETQSRLITALLDAGRFPHAAKSVRVVETHISWVLLAGRYAYKIKKAVDLGFLDFTRLEARGFYCSEEIRLNRRLAPRLYLDTIPIGGSPDAPLLGATPAIEYAVRMRRFPTSRQMDRLLAKGKVTTAHLDRLAGTVARFHAGLPAAEPGTEFGTPAVIRAAAMQNFDQLRTSLADANEAGKVAAAGRSTEAEYAACERLFEQRLAQGFVRECHGDLHLGNIVLVGDEPVPFDGIDFNPALRWIDVMNELAFPVMDLLHRGHPELAFRFLNAYLEATGDYAGMPVLRFYVAYRAAVRAKVSAIRAGQPDISGKDAREAVAACHSYLDLCLGSLASRRSALIITHGLPGSGKTTFSQLALERLGAVRIRSDVERKRLFGLSATDESGSGAYSGIYSATATERTYDRLHELARGMLKAGFPVIVDAAFLKRRERARFRELAQALRVPFARASIQATPATLRARVARRHREKNDASEADLAVLRMLEAAREPPAPEEEGCLAEFVTDRCDGDLTGCVEGWNRLASLLEDMRIQP